MNDGTHIEMNVIKFDGNTTPSLPAPAAPPEWNAEPTGDSMDVRDASHTSSIFCEHMRRLSTRSDVVSHMIQYAGSNPEFGPPQFAVLHLLFPLADCVLFDQIGTFPVEIQPQVPISDLELPMCLCDLEADCAHHTTDSGCGCYRLLSRYFQLAPYDVVCPVPENLLERLCASVEIYVNQSTTTEYVVTMSETLKLIHNVLSWNVEINASNACIHDKQMHLSWVPDVLQTMMNLKGAKAKGNMSDLLRRIFASKAIQPLQPFLPLLVAFVRDAFRNPNPVIRRFFTNKSIRAVGSMRAVWALVNKCVPANGHGKSSTVVLCTEADTKNTETWNILASCAPCHFVVHSFHETYSTQVREITLLFRITIPSAGCFVVFELE